MNKTKLLAIDNYLYQISQTDYDEFNMAVGSCCGVNCPETRQSLRNVMLRIKAKYAPIDCEFHRLPEYEPTSSQMAAKDLANMDSDDLPF